MKTLLSVSVFVFLAIISGAQDSLVRFSELKFESDFEQQAFRKYFKQNNSEAVIQLLLAVTADGPARNTLANTRIDDFIKKLEASGVSSKKPEKKVKTVYDQVHSSFFIKYEMVNRFSEIFATGNYNCVTATALYALIFDRLKIPYSIQEKPTHVFLVAYPNQNNILVETTSPLFGYLTFDDRYKQTFVNNLKSSKLIAASEVTSQSTDALFNKYYFQNEGIDLNKLIGIHYMNDGLFRNDSGDVLGAFQQCEKAYFFYPSQRCAFLLTSFGAEILQQQKLKPIERAWMVAKISRYRNQGITTEMVKGEFMRLNEEVLVKQNNRTLYQDCADVVVNNGLQDDELKSEIRYIQYYELGRTSYNQGNYHQAKYFFAKALDHQPNNTELSATFFSTMLMTMRNKQEDAAVLDTVLVYKKRFPALESNNNFASLVANAYLIAAADKIGEGDIKSAEEYQKQFEEMYSKNKDLLIDSYAAGAAYSKLCAHYFKKGQKEKARMLVKKGLEIAPDNYELRTRQQMLN